MHSIHTPLLRRGLYKALSHGFCACSGVLKITLYCVQKLGTVHQTADSCTPQTIPGHRCVQMPQTTKHTLQGNRNCYGAMEHLILGYVLICHNLSYHDLSLNACNIFWFQMMPLRQHSGTEKTSTNCTDCTFS